MTGYFSFSLPLNQWLNKHKSKRNLNKKLLLIQYFLKIISKNKVWSTNLKMARFALTDRSRINTQKLVFQNYPEKTDILSSTTLKPVKWASITYLCVCCWFHTLLLLKFEFYFQLKLELWSYIFHISFRNSLKLFTKIYPSQLFFQNNNSRLSSGKEVSIKKNCYQALSLILCISERELTLQGL